MRFLSFPQRAKYVVRPTRKVFIDGQPDVQRGLTARFLNHTFDSDKTQAQLGWTDAERKQVEDHLLAHPDFERHGGIYLDEIVEGKQQKVARMPSSLASADQPRCVAFIRNEEGEAEQCPRSALEDGDLCEEHAAASVAVGGDDE